MTRLDYLILVQRYFYVGSDYSFVFPQEGPFGKRMLMTSTRKMFKKETCGMCPWACPVGVGVRVREGEAGEEMHE
jgi:hypothetical protein